MGTEDEKRKQAEEDEQEDLELEEEDAEDVVGGERWKIMQDTGTPPPAT